ncbi:hypothetical protein RUND412_004296 [Rhizina undulata]
MCKFRVTHFAGCGHTSLSTTPVEGTRCDKPSLCSCHRSYNIVRDEKNDVCSACWQAGNFQWVWGPEENTVEFEDDFEDKMLDKVEQINKQSKDKIDGGENWWNSGTLGKRKRPMLLQ